MGLFWWTGLLVWSLGGCAVTALLILALVKAMLPGDEKDDFVHSPTYWRDKKEQD